MKKNILLVIIVMLLTITVNVNAEVDSATIIGKSGVGDLMCAYTQTQQTDKGKGKEGDVVRTAIYYNKDTGVWTVFWDKSFHKKNNFAKASVGSKSGKLSYIFSKKGTNVDYENITFTNLKEGICPNYGGLNTDGVNRACFGSSESVQLKVCKPNAQARGKTTYLFEKTYDYRTAGDVNPELIDEVVESIQTFSKDDEFIGDSFCIDAGVRRALKIVGFIVLIARYIAPILLIIMGSVDFAKASLAGTTDSIKKQAKKFGIRLVIAIAVFFVPMIIHAVLNITEVLPLEYYYCEECLLDPQNC